MNNLIFYAALAVAIAVVVYAALSLTTGGQYEVSLALAHTQVASLFPYNTTHFVILVNNTGSEYISGLLVGFYVNGQAYHNYNVSIPGGKAATIPVNFTYPQQGNYSFEAIVDPGHLSRLSDYNGTQITMYVSVSNATRPEPLSSLPGNGIESSYVFDFPGDSVAVPTLMHSSYNTTLTGQIFSPMRGVLYGLSKNLYTLLNGTYGAAATYSDGSGAEAVWLQGTFAEPLLYQIISSYGPREETSGQYRVFYMPGNTTICVSYSGGWTKLLSYTSGSGTCASAAPANGTESAMAQGYASSFPRNSPIMLYVGNFTYTNSTVIATQYGLGNGSKYAATWFSAANSVFVSYVNESASQQPYQNRTCYGLLSNDVVCSEYVFPEVNSTTTKSSALILSREFVGNYLLSLYSWVDNQSELDANYNAAMLLGAITAGQAAEKWASAYASSCSFNSTYAIGCSVTSFDSSTHVASVRLTNLANSTITLNSASCYTPGLQGSETLGLRIAPQSSGAFNVTCHYSVLLPAIGIQDSYLFYLNYTRSGSTSAVIGFLNTSNVV